MALVACPPAPIMANRITGPQHRGLYCNLTSKMTSMRVACSTISFGSLPVGETLDRIAGAGFTVIDLAAVPRIFPHVDLVAGAVDQGDQLAKQLAVHGLEVFGLQSGPWIPDAIDDPAELHQRYTVAADVA